MSRCLVFPSSINGDIALLKTQCMMSSTAVAYTMVSSTFDSSISDVHICIGSSTWIIDETKVEETIVCTTVMDDVIRHAIWRGISPLVSDKKTWVLDRSCHFLLICNLMSSKYNSETSATDPFNTLNCDQGGKHGFDEANWQSSRNSNFDGQLVICNNYLLDGCGFWTWRING